MTIKQHLTKFRRWFIEVNSKNSYKPAYRIVEIFQDEEEDYFVLVQVINKNSTFKSKPEELLANDLLVDQFSPRDVRSLTYLGYLGINSPKYKILAKRLSENDDKLIFALKKKGERSLIVKTAEEIMQEKDILDCLHAKDANIIGYAFASESLNKEALQKNNLIKHAEH